MSKVYITATSYQALKESGAKAWAVRDKFFTLIEKLDASQQDLVIEVEPAIDRRVTGTALEQAKARKQFEIIERAKTEQDNLVADYSPAEQNSWSRKVAEAKLVLSTENLADANLLRTEVTVLSGATEESEILDRTIEFAKIILAKSEELYLASAAISGKRSKLWLMVDSLRSIEEVEAVEWTV